MRKLILLMLLLCAVIASGCSENVPPKEDAKNAVTAAVQEKKDISFIVYRAASDGSEKLLPEKITMKDNGKSLPENALIALVTTKPQDAKMDDVLSGRNRINDRKLLHVHGNSPPSKESSQKGVPPEYWKRLQKAKSKRNFVKKLSHKEVQS